MPYKNSAGKIMDINWTSKVNVWQANAAGAETVRGTDDSDSIFAGKGDTAIGGKGDDIYALSDTSVKIVENADGGNDLVMVVDKYVLPDNVENLLLNANDAWFGGGNSLDNIIMATLNMTSKASVSMDGGAGNDVLIGGGGKDTFIARAGNGSDVVYRFDVKADSVALFNYGITSFSQVSSLARQNGADTILQLSKSETLTLRDTNASSLTSANFQLQKDISSLKLSFADDFTSTISLNTGTAATAGGTWKTSYFWNPASWLTSRYLHSEQQVYTDLDFKGTSSSALGVNPLSIKDGILTITAAPVTSAVQSFVGKQTYTSGLINTDGSFSQQYGYFETRAQMDSGNGLWPAFWLLPTDHSWPPEIDIFEQLGRDPNTVYMTSHAWNGTDGGKFYVDTSVMHTYGLDWNKDFLIWYIDGTEVFRTATPDSMRKEMYVLLNLAVGDGWAGPADASTGVGEFKIDYVHVYENADTVSKTVKGVKTLVTSSATNVPTPAASSPAVVEKLPDPAVTAPVVTPPAVVASTPASTVKAPSASATTTTPPASTTTTTTLPASATTTTLPASTTTTTQSVFNGTDKSDRLVSLGVVGTILNGGAGDDQLFAQGANNKLIGGSGSDAYYITDTTQIIVEEIDGGYWDTVSSSVNYTLSPNIESMILTGKENIYGYGNDQANSITGNAGDNLLRGYGGDDALDGGIGADRMEGGLGNDRYVVDNVGDIVVEQPSEGWDGVSSSISYTLTANVETLNLTGTANLEGNGNELNNNLTGNSGDNILRGYGGNDTIDGGAGADRMEGGLGDDTYMVDNVGDVVVELAAQGTDRIYSTVSYSLGANVEQLYLQGNAAINATGNALDNVLGGNAGNNVINGGKGNDYMTGGGGSDTFVFTKGDGRDWVGDFDAKNDVLKLVGIDASSLKIVQSGKDAIVSYGTAGDTVTLVGVSASDPLLKSHILFA